MGYLLDVSIFINVIAGILVYKSTKDNNEFNSDLQHLARVNERLAGRLKGIGIDIAEYYKGF